MANLTIVFSKSRSKFAIFSWLIMASERTPYSHVAINMIDPETNDGIYFQASHTFVNCMGVEIFCEQEEIIKSFNFEISEKTKAKIKDFAIKQLGKPYGILSIIGLAWVQICKWFGKKIHNPFKENGETYVCDQLVATIMKECANIDFSESINDMTPKDLFPLVASWPTKLD